MFKRILGVILSIIGWEYVAIRLSTFNMIRPSGIIDGIANIFKWIFGGLGQLWAIISSFYVHLKLDDLFQAIMQILTAIWHLVTSGFEFVVGYETIANAYDNPYLIWGGSFTLIVGTLYGITRLCQVNNPWCKQCGPIVLYIFYGLLIIFEGGYFYWNPQNKIIHTCICGMLLGIGAYINYFRLNLNTVDPSVQHGS